MEVPLMILVYQKNKNCETLRETVYETPINCLNKTSGGLLTISADEYNLAFTINVRGLDDKGMYCNNVLIPNSIAFLLYGSV